MLNLRRATSYSGTSGGRDASASHSNDVADLLIGSTTVLNSKHRRQLLAKQAWIKYQLA